jgi:hypothetical protein
MIRHDVAKGIILQLGVVIFYCDNFKFVSDPNYSITKLF